VLSQLTSRINKVSASDARLRQHQRRIRVLWTLYTCFAYVIAALILTLVTGFRNWDALEYSGMAGGPVVIYGVRLAIDAYYNFRLSGTQSQLNDLQRQRESAIEKLKAATKYNSTQELLNKYGGSDSPASGKSNSGKGSQDFGARKQAPQPVRIPQGGRTGIAPPPTANIPGRQVHNAPSSASSAQPPPRTPTMTDFAAGEEFAPNAFTSSPTSPATHAVTAAAPEYAPPSAHGGGARWYDRILDVVLGEDETAPKNRIVLVCHACRLVNGQAPPGTRTLDDVGKWRCMACGTMNGHESEARKMIRQVAGSTGAASKPSEDGGAAGVDDQGVDKSDVEAEDEDEDGARDSVRDVDGAVDVSAERSPAASTRSKVRQRKNQ